MDSKELVREYDQIFDDVEKVFDLLKIESSAYTREIKNIEINKIGLAEPSKKGRKDTRLGLTRSIKELGVVNPIVVMTTESYEEECEEDEIKFDYMLIDGLRRIYGARKNGLKRIDAIVFNFSDKEKGRQIALALGLTLSKTQRRTWQEIWELHQILEMQSNLIITPGTLEYLLDIEPGDSMKLKDLMLSDDEEAKNELLMNKKSLQQCYNLLQKHRKEVDLLEKEDNTGISVVEGAKEIIKEDDNNGQILSDSEVMEILEMSDSIDSIDDEDFGALNSSLTGDERQKVGERHIVDPAIKQGTFVKDDFKCICCGTGDVAFLGALVYHHKIPVHCGGPDTVENGATLCDTCHITVHIAERAGGKLHMTKEQFESYDEKQQLRIKKILSLAKIAVKAAQIKGSNKKEIASSANKEIRHRMPGEGLKENNLAYNQYKKEVS